MGQAARGDHHHALVVLDGRNRPSDALAQFDAAAHQRQRGGEHVDHQRHDRHVEVVQQVLHGVCLSVVDLQLRRDGDLRAVLDQVLGEGLGECRIGALRALRGATVTGRHDLVDTERERGDQVEPETPEVVGADHDGDVGTGDGDRLPGLGERVAEPFGPVHAGDLVPVGVHQRRVGGADAEHDTGHYRVTSGCPSPGPTPALLSRSTRSSVASSASLRHCSRASSGR